MADTLGGHVHNSYKQPIGDGQMSALPFITIAKQSQSCIQQDVSREAGKLFRLEKTKFSGLGC